VKTMGSALCREGAKFHKVVSGFRVLVVRWLILLNIRSKKGPKNMPRRIYTIIVIMLSLAAVAGATLVGVQKAASQKAKAAAQKPGSAPAASKQKPKAAPNVAAPAAPIRPADPNRAPQPAVDDALYTNEEFFGVQSTVVRPYAVALERVSALLAQYPKDSRLRLHAARLSERLGQYDRAASEMTQYTDLKRRSPDALRRLANFYHERARFADEVRTLQELAKALRVGERAPIYKRAATVVRSHTLKEFKPSDFFAELVAADPLNIEPVQDYVEELRLANQNNDALAVLVSFQAKFPSELAYFLRTRAQVLEITGDRRAAEQVYSDAFDANWPRVIAGDYFELLRKFGRYRVVRRGLQERVRAGATDLQTVARLFSIFAYESNYEQASALLADLEARRAGRTVTTRAANQTRAASATDPAQSSLPRNAWNGRELETVAGMFTSIGDYDQASRYLYTLYLTGGLQPASQSREDALYRLFRVMIDAAGTPTRVASGDLSLYKDIAQVDQRPGFMNGVLSLVLSGNDTAQEFSNQETAAAGYFNRAFAYRIFNSFKQEYAQSRHLADMYLGIVNVFAALGEHRLAIEAGREFGQRFPDSRRYSEVLLRIADSYVVLKDRAGERAILAELLDRVSRARAKGAPLLPIAAKRWTYGITPRVEQLVDRIKYNIEAYSDTYDPTEGGGGPQIDDDDNDDDDDDSWRQEFDDDSSKRGPTYSGVLERYISSLAVDDKKTETVALFWGEIKKHPKEEGLYERFLRWLGSSELVNEQLKAYNSAIRQFDSNTWYHRLGRWYVRQKRGRELTRYSRQLIGIFDEEEITDYLLRFAGYGSTAAGDGLNWDQRLAFDLYSYAHTRFPRNLYFVRGMLTYLANNDLKQWEKLSAEYYFADRTIREPYLTWLSRQNQLRARFTQASSRVSGGAATARDQAVPPGPYAVFAADAAMWLSHHDEALNAYRQLVALYPGEPQYADRLADLTRSFGQQSDEYYEESARVLAQMADIYPSDHLYRVKAGEVYAELGDFNRAGEQWNKLIQLEPGERNTYLEVATVFWDYYQFDQAVRVFTDLRNTTGDQSIYAYRLGAVYEGKGDIDSAIAEYIKVLPEPGSGRDTVAKRLAQLSRRAGLAEKITAAYQQAHAAHPEDWQLVIGYANYQAERDHQADALAMLRTEVSRSSDVVFLETVRDLFAGILRPEDQQQVITRLTAVARDEREAMMYRLQLASFLERHSQVDAAVGVIDKLVQEYPTNVGVIEESAQFYWRAGLLDRSLDLYKQTLARAQGPNRRTLTLQYSRRQSDAGKLGDAEATLRAYYNENHSDTEVFAELARTLGAQNKMSELAALYQEAFKDARESGLGTDEAKAHIGELRAGMIRTLTSLGRFEEAVDQYIEVINLFPEDADRLATAIDYAEQHNLVERLVTYYEKLSKESYKNYRWQLVLGRIYERRGNLAGASEQYRIATVNEPQRFELRLIHASTLTRQRRYDEAIAVLQQVWTLAGRDPQWLIEVARIQIQQGKRDEAVQTMRQALAAKKDANAEASLAVASQLAAWGINAEAVRQYEQTFAALPQRLKNEGVSSSQVAGYVRALVKTEAPASAYQKLERLRSQFQAIKENSRDTDSYRASNIVSAIDDAMRSDFGQGVIDYSGASEATALASAIQSSIAKLTLYTDAETLRRYLGIARSANLVDTEETIQARLKDAAFNARPKNPTTIGEGDAAYYSELRALINFYDRHAAYSRAADMLASEYDRDPYKNRFDYQTQIAAQYRLAGNTARELEFLRAAYKAASSVPASSANGPDIAVNNEWVDRYISLLYSSGLRDELDLIAGAFNPHQLQLINFFIEKNEKALARKAISNAQQPDGWAASRSAEVGLFLKDTSAETESYFKKALFIRPIGELLNRQGNSEKALMNDDWFIVTRNYGYWLGLVTGREGESQNYLAGEVEGHPTSARAQLELAAYYLDHKDTTRAADHTQLASELAPGSSEVTVLRGAVTLARGDRKGALDQWGTMMSGSVSISEAETYLKVMADNGFMREALPQLEGFLVAYVNRAMRGKDGDTRMAAISSLIREIANRARTDAKLTGEVATFFHTAITSMPGDLTIGRMLIEESLLPEASLASIYRTMHQRLSDAATAVFGTSEYEDGYFNGNQYIYPAKALADWRRRFVDYLIRARSFDEARLLIATINQEQSNNSLALETRSGDEESDDSTGEDRYDWLPLASALVELRGGGDSAKAVAGLRDYCGLNREATHESDDEGSDGDHVQTQCLKAYALLVAEGRASDAEALLYDAYRASARTRFANDASLAGLAEIEARRGRADEAGRLLKLMVERSTDNLKALGLAAETAARINRFADAVDFREQIARVNPDDAENKLELARAMAAGGQRKEAVDRIVALIGERTTSNSVRAQAAEVVGEIVRADRSQAARASLFDQMAGRGHAGALLAQAAISEATGELDRSRSLLERVSDGPLAAVDQMKLGIIALSGGREPEAATRFERAIYLDADGAITNAIAFRASVPRAQLISLYSRMGRDAAAIRLAEGDEPGTGDQSRHQSLISGAVRSRLLGGGNDDETTLAYAFEPSLEIARSKGDGLKTLDELNEAASTRMQSDLITPLVESASKLGQYDRAIAIERLHASEATRPEEKSAIERRLAELIAAERARDLRAASLLRIDRSNAIQSIYAARVIGR
jgi:predicted Zn-dependent protease